jgi:hypothetical protein
MYGDYQPMGDYDEYDPMGEPLQFMTKDTKEKKPVSDKPTKVRVSDRWQVIHDGKPYTKGDTLTVPEHLAEEWDRSRWVERVTQRT